MRRRRAKFTWLPNTGTVTSTDTSNVPYSFNFSNVRPNPDNSVLDAEAIDAEAIVIDQTEFTNANNISMRDQVEGQEYLLKRIVGSIQAFVDPSESFSDGLLSWPGVILTAGILVARAQDDNEATIDLTLDEYDPQNQHNIMQPWVWRRSWLLRNELVTTNQTMGIDVPSCNMSFGDVRSGPHIDSKVARRIRKEHRLWLVFRARGFSGVTEAVTGTGPNQPQVRIVADLRFLGAMRRAKNSSSF